jgi:DNA-directed RNA polymerase subunit M/transcription elongation factor TFIIS
MPVSVNLTYFVQECPTCGRRLQVSVEYLGRKVACQHCGKTFTARDPAQPLVATVESPDEVLERRVAAVLGDKRLAQQAG